MMVDRASIDQHMGEEVQVILVATDCQVSVTGILGKDQQTGAFVVVPTGGGATAEFGPNAIAAVQLAGPQANSVQLILRHGLLEQNT